MRIPITGAAGMVGRKLAERLAGHKRLAGRPFEKLLLHDIVQPLAPDGIPADTRTGDLAADGACADLMQFSPDTIPDDFHPTPLTSYGTQKLVGELLLAGQEAVLIREEPDPAIWAIVRNWPTRFAATRAKTLGFRAEESFDEIMRVRIEDELEARASAR